MAYVDVLERRTAHVTMFKAMSYDVLPAACPAGTRYHPNSLAASYMATAFSVGVLSWMSWVGDSM
jgi:hypothetical protein